MIRFFPKTLTLVFLCVSLASCSFPMPGDDIDIILNEGGEDIVIDQGPVKGGTVRLFSTNPDTLNPLYTKNRYVRDVLWLVYEGLVRLDKNGRAVPCLATSWTVSEDRLEWTFRLRDRVYWHDKKPFTADDVVYTIKTIRENTVDSIYKVNLSNLAGVTAPNKNTVKIKLVEPDSFLPELLAIPIIPKHKHDGDDFKNLRSSRNMTPVGTGPFVFSSFKDNSLIRLEAYKNWWDGKRIKDSDITLPYLDAIEVAILPTLDDALAKFQTGEIDVVPVAENTGNKYSYRNDLIIRRYADREFDYLLMNPRHSLLKNADFRKALVYSIDKNELVNSVLPGEAMAADLPISPENWVINTGIISYVPDSAEAVKILKKLGYTNKDGVMVRNNAPLALELLVNSGNGSRIKVAENIKKQLAEVGIEIQIKAVNASQLKYAIENGYYDIALIGCRVPSVPDISFLYGTGNISGYSNPEVDRLLSEIKLEHDAEKKKMLFSDLKRIINEDIPYIGLYFKTNAIIYNKRIKGDMSPAYHYIYNDIAQWYIPESEDGKKP